MNATGKSGQFGEAGSSKSDQYRSDRSRCRSELKSRLFVLVADDEHAISRIKELASTCIEIEGAASEEESDGPWLLDLPRAATLRDRLTHRQFEIALGVARGLSNKDIGRELGISHFTARNHLSQILLILGLSSRQELGGLLRARPTCGNYTKMTNLYAGGERIPDITRQAGN